MSEPNNRREFLEQSLIAGAVLGLATAVEAADEDRKGLTTRPLGKTGRRVSMLCLGGWHIGFIESEKEAITTPRSGMPPLTTS
jgi:hypothetical protein